MNRLNCQFAGRIRAGDCAIVKHWRHRPILAGTEGRRRGLDDRGIATGKEWSVERPHAMAFPAREPSTNETRAVGGGVGVSCARIR